MDVLGTQEWESPALFCPSCQAVCLQGNYLASLSLALRICELESRWPCALTCVSGHSPILTISMDTAKKHSCAAHRGCPICQRVGLELGNDTGVLKALASGAGWMGGLRLEPTGVLSQNFASLSALQRQGQSCLHPYTTLDDHVHTLRWVGIGH